MFLGKEVVCLEQPLCLVNKIHSDNQNKMKKSILVISSTVFIIGAFLSSCNNPSETMIIAEKKTKEANESLVKVQYEFLKTIEQYRLRTARRILTNTQSIEELKARTKLEKREANHNLEKKILALEQRNNEMKKRLDDYKEVEKDKWEIFKKGFNKDMDELDKAFQDLGTKNTE